MTPDLTKQTLTQTAETVLERRYYLKDADGKAIETWETLSRRVADAIAAVDKEQEGYAELREEFFQMIYRLDFLPNSPCLMNAGTDLGQLSACFVLPVEDSMDGIFTAIRNGALVHKTGGGTGYSFSRLRSKNASVRSTQGVASGPLSFAAVFDAATETIKQGGKRRGANMGVLRVDHPDIMDFIGAKKDQERFNNFNFSVGITDAFMQALEEGGMFDLVEPSTGQVVNRLNARKVFDEIVALAWLNGEPGVLFIDSANRDNTTPQLGDFEATNPCGEQWLLPYESCNLGSVNLANFVADGEIDYERLRKVVRVATVFLDNVIDCNRFPIPEIEEMTLKTRKIGMGIMGMHDMLIQMELSYCSEAGRELCGKVMQFIHDTSRERSEELAVEKGAFPAYDPKVNKYTPRRNAALTSIQPTGTVSMIANCASGCEPYFSIVMVKHVMDDDRLIIVNRHFEKVAHEEGFYSDDLMSSVADSGSSVGHAGIPEKWQEIFRTAQDIPAEDHIKMQGILQKSGVDSSISKTINLPSSAGEEDVRNAYISGYRMGCKGLTVYRDGSRDNQVLNTGKQSEEKQTAVVSSQGPVKENLPDVLDAKRYRVKDQHDQWVYIIVCFDENQKPMEVFAKFPFDNQIDLSDKSTMWTTACRLVSLALRFSVPMEEIIKQLERSSGHMRDLPAQLSRLLKTFMAGTHRGFSSNSKCPVCANKLVYAEGCETCYECGYSKCS